MTDRWLCGPRRPLWHLALYCLSGWAAAGEPAPVVQVDGGKIRGEQVNVGGVAVMSFKAIPFAQPPVGELRIGGRRSRPNRGGWRSQLHEVRPGLPATRRPDLQDRLQGAVGGLPLPERLDSRQAWQKNGR